MGSSIVRFLLFTRCQVSLNLLVRVNKNRTHLPIMEVNYLCLCNTLLNYRDLIGYLRSHDIK